jgi:diguanylate cyclase (GGDEF)-like protein/PAS domain S-box-containing protein
MKYHFTDLVDIEAFQSMLTAFYEATGILHGLVDNEGNIISGCGWQDACTQFHRVHPETCRRCQESNLEMAEHLQDRGYAGGLCRNGLMDYATPIVIDGQQLATLYFGQCLHEPPNLEFFLAQARQYGFDEDAYLAAIRKLPIIPEENVRPIMAFYTQLAQMLAEAGLNRQREREAEDRLALLNRDLEHRIEERTTELAARNAELAAESLGHQQVAKALSESEARLQAILELSPVGIGWSRDGKIEYVNRKFTEMFGYRLEDIPTLDRWYQLAYPDETFRSDVLVPWTIEVEAARRAGTNPPALEAPVACKDGSVCYVIISLAWSGDRRLTNFSDITERWHAEQREQARNAILELIAKDASLTQTLSALVSSIEAEDRRMLCSIVLLDDEGRHLQTTIAPSLPAFYSEAISGLEIGLGVGSCGTAAFTRQRVVVDDIQTHPYWAPYKAIAQQAGLGACWSEPILSPKGEVLGTFAIYHHEPCMPTQEDLLRIARAANLASIAIERHRVQHELERQANTDFLTGLTNRRHFIDRAAQALTQARRNRDGFSMLMLDIDHFKAINDTHGHQSGDLVLQQVARALQSAVRGIDLVARIGGEEFAVMLPNTDEENAVLAAERLRLAVAGSELHAEGGAPLQVTLSIGVASTSCHANRPLGIDTLLQEADRALYAAKKQGRNRVCTAG